MTLRKLDTPEIRAYAIQELADLEIKLEPLERRAEELRRYLGLLPLELGLEEIESVGSLETNKE